MRTFLFSIARNLAFKRFRDDHSNLQADEDLALSIPDERAGQEISVVVAQMVAQLLDLHREALILFEYEGFQLTEILQISIVYIAAYPVKHHAAEQKSGGGGGGGQRMKAPVSRGAAPNFALQQFLLPAMAVPKPLLPVAPTITAQAPQIAANEYGDPLSNLLSASGGPGSNGLGAGAGGGLAVVMGTGTVRAQVAESAKEFIASAVKSQLQFSSRK